MHPVLISRKSVNGAACDFVADLFIALREDILISERVRSNYEVRATQLNCLLI